MIIGFAKYEGTGNDFIIIDARTFEFEFTPELIASLCDRSFGIGADGLIVLGLARGRTDFDMRCYNSFGFEVSICGNGGRCVALFAHHQGIGGREKVFGGIDGLHRAKVIKADDLQGCAEFLLGCNAGTVKYHKDDLYITDTGMLQCVVFVRGIEDVDVLSEGREMSSRRGYGRKAIDVNFAETTGEGRFRLRSYSCVNDKEANSLSSGALAAAMLLRAVKQPACREFTAITDGGELRLSIEENNNGDISGIWLKGAGRKVFHGKFETDNFPVII